MPTFQVDEPFWRGYDRLSVRSQNLFGLVRAQFISDLRIGSFRPSLRVKRVTGHPGVWEMTWAPDGRATFSYGAEVILGQAHIVWRRIGTHDIFRQP